MAGLRCLAIVGLGAAGGFAANALAGRDDIQLVAGVDPCRGAQADTFSFPVVDSVHALAQLDRLDVVVVSVPTSLHYEVCTRLVEDRVADEVWCEKPLTSLPADFASLLDTTRESQVALRVLLHTAFAPEVLWAADHLAKLVDSHGPPVAAQGVFNDPYAAELKTRRASLADSWLDSGINALSVLWRLFTLNRVKTASGTTPMTADVCLQLGFGEVDLTATVRTNWDAADAVKTTTISLADGYRLVLDHSLAMARLLDADDKACETHEFGRKPLDSRYRAMFDAYLSDTPLVPTLGDVVMMHELLFAAQQLIARPQDHT